MAGVEPLFVVSDALVARYLSTHPKHAQAVTAWGRLALERRPLLSSEGQITRAVSALARACDPGFAAARGQAIFASRLLTMLVPDADDRLAALQALSAWRGPDPDLDHCLAMVLMRRTGVTAVFTAEPCYAHAGLTCVLLP